MQPPVQPGYRSPGSGSQTGTHHRGSVAPIGGYSRGLPSSDRQVLPLSVHWWVPRVRLDQAPVSWHGPFMLVDGVEPDLDQALSPRTRDQGLRVPDDLRPPGQLQRVSGLPVQEQQPGSRVDGQIPQGLEHAVAAVVGKGQPTAVVGDLDESWAAAAMRGVSAAFGVGAGDEERVGPAHECRLAGIERLAPAEGWRGRSGGLPGQKPALDVFGAVAKRLRHGQHNSLAGALRYAVEADPLPGAELDCQHADLGLGLLKGALQWVSGSWPAGQQDLAVV